MAFSEAIDARPICYGSVERRILGRKGGIAVLVWSPAWSGTVSQSWSVKRKGKGVYDS